MRREIKQKLLRTEQHHGDVFLEPLPSNDAGAVVGAGISAVYGRDVELAYRFAVLLHVHSTQTPPQMHVPLAPEIIEH